MIPTECDLSGSFLFLRKPTESYRKIYKHTLEDEYDGNSDHKFGVLCFVAYKLHTNEHCNRAAKRGKDKQRAFGCTQGNAVELGYLFVVYANDN